MLSTTPPSITTQQCELCHLQNESVFCNLEKSDWASLNAGRTTRTFARGEIIYTDGDDPAGLYCIYSGGVKVFKNGHTGKDQIIRFARSGDIVGYRALLSGEVYTNTATALGESQVCFIPRAAFLAVAAVSSRLNIQLFGLLSQELRKAESRMVAIAQRPLRERVAETLLFLKQSFGLERDGKTLSIRLSRREISDVVGAATESVIRSLAELKSEGIIDMEGKCISIRQHDQLVLAASIDS